MFFIVAGSEEHAVRLGIDAGQLQERQAVVDAIGDIEPGKEFGGGIVICIAGAVGAAVEGGAAVEAPSVAVFPHWHAGASNEPAAIKVHQATAEEDIVEVAGSPALRVGEVNQGMGNGCALGLGRRNLRRR